ncbi:MAG: toxin-antitoxin system YwqK family antitoxin, partial [Chlamydiales bacterium]
MKNILLAFFLCFGSTVLHGQMPGSQSVMSGLKPRQPNWRLDIVQLYPHGTPQTVVFYEPQLDGTERLVKQVLFFENGQIQTEADVILVAVDSPIAKEWNSNIVPHGVRVDFTQNGALLRTSHYHEGKMVGECTFFYPSGKINAVTHYEKGLLEGPV